MTPHITLCRGCKSAFAKNSCAILRPSSSQVALHHWVRVGCFFVKNYHDAMPVVTSHTTAKGKGEISILDLKDNATVTHSTGTHLSTQRPDAELKK